MVTESAAAGPTNAKAIARGSTKFMRNLPTQVKVSQANRNTERKPLMIAIRY